MLPKLADLLTESDVEQKLLWPILTAPYPDGLGYSTADIFTKLSTRRLEIGKGKARHLYYPDYLIVLAGLPVLVIEAKHPNERLPDALSEARLYGNEINALLPHGLNPCVRVLACNGAELWTTPVDQAEPDLQLSYSDLSPANVLYEQLVSSCRRDTLQANVDAIRRRLRCKDYERPVHLVGGEAFQNEELPQNTFGATIVGDYGHIFNPRTRQDRELIVRSAYVASLRRQRYVEPIDRLIRNAVAPTAAKIEPLADTRDPKEIISALRDRKKLTNQILLLVGSVGAGKSTFVDYLSFVALPAELREKTVWLRLNLNDAPLDVSHAYDWVARGIAAEFIAQFPDIDLDAYETLEKIFRGDLRALKKGPLAILDPASTEYRVRLADRLTSLQSNPLARAKGIAQFICAGPERLLVVVLDNCDKRNRDEQLTMFQLAQWVQSEFHCLVVLPLRDVTFDLYRRLPPLDAALKQFIFRIEPPQFSDVLQARVRLALEEIGKSSRTARRLSYLLPNGMKVTYPAEDQALYLASILRSLYAHDRFVRQVMTGLAGRDVRLALEIFLDFCMSGHIGEDEIYKIRFFEGQHVLPLSIVARVLLRMQRRFYDGDKSYLKNIVQCSPDDSLPDHFVRLTTLQWFGQRLRVKGPAGVNGFHRASDMLRDLAALGHDSRRVRDELGYLIRAGCLVAEHLRSDEIEEQDLVKVTAAGVIHLQLMANPEYLAACAEDTWIAEPELCRRIAERLSKGPREQFSAITTARNARELVDYLKQRLTEWPRSPDVYLEESATAALNTLREAESGIAASEIALPKRLFVRGLAEEVTEVELRGMFEQREIQLRDIALPRDKKTGRSRGYAFVEPTTGRGIIGALDLDGALRLHGRRLRISEAHPFEEAHIKQVGHERPRPPLSTRVYVGNLPYTFREIDVRSLFATHELTPVDVFVMNDKTSGRSRGAGFVELKSMDEALRAIGALDGADVEGRKLLVRPADPKEKDAASQGHTSRGRRARGRPQ